MIKCIIIDDEQSSIDIIERYIKRIPNLQLLGTFTDPLKALAFNEVESIDTVFLDIEMEELSGIDVAQSLKGKQIIFCTAHSEFAAQSYDIGAVDYLLKPIPFNRFVKAIQRLYNAEIPKAMAQDIIDGDYFFVRTELKGKYKKIELDQLDYIEARNNCIAFVVGNEKTIAYTTLKSMEENLSANQFFRIHKSYIVAIRQVTMIENNQVVLKSKNIKLPIGESYKEAFMDKMKDHFPNF